MNTPESLSFQLKNFEGPLDFLLHLIQKEEIDIYEISLKTLTTQFCEKMREEYYPSLANGAEFIGMTALLLHIKSRMLLPKHEQEFQESGEENDPRFEIIHQLLDYCRFKEAARDLTDLEQEQSAFYLRGDSSTHPKKPLGIEHLSLEDLACLFKELLAKSNSQRGLIHEELWRVSDKILLIREWLKKAEQISFGQLFSVEFSKAELIVTFLAILELMKLGDLRFIKDLSSGKVMFIKSGL